MKQELFEQNIHPLYRSYLIPTVVAMLANSLYCLVDVYFIGKAAGGIGLAAVNIVMPMYTVYSSIALVFSVGTSTIMSIAYGNKDFQTRNKAFTLCIKSLLVIGIAMTLLGWLFMEELAYALGANKELLPHVLSYLKPVHTVCFMFIFAYATPLLLRNDYNPKLAMQATLLGNITNIILDYVFVIHFQMGIFGAALATAISPCLSVSFAMLHFIHKQNHVYWMKGKIDYGLWRRIIRNGFGSGVMEISAGIVILLFNLVILKIANEIDLAAFAIITNIAYVCKGLFNGFAQAAQPLLASNYGAKKMQRVQESFIVSMRYICIFAISVYLLFLLFPTAIATLFAGSDATLMSITKKGILIYFCCLPFLGANTIYLYYFQSLEKGMVAIVLALCKGILFIMIGLIVFVPIWKMNGVWICVAFAEMMSFFIAYLCKKKEANV